MAPTADEPARAEVMAVAIARRLRDGETIAVGSVSPIPASACLLAKRLHAPAARLILLGSRAHFPFNGGVQEFYNYAVRGRLDVFFASGAQIDGHGNFNLSVIGDYDRPPSGCRAGAQRHPLLRGQAPHPFPTEHSRRVFVPRVDFITSPGTTPEGVYRIGGLHAVVTDLCVFEFDRAKGRLELGTVHPGVTLAEVESRTGFPLHAPSPVPASPTPSAEELALLRGPVREELGTSIRSSSSSSLDGSLGNRQ